MKTISKSHSNAQRHKTKMFMVRQSILALGLIMAVCCMVYMLLHLASADSIISVWLPFMVSSVALIVLSRLL